MKKFVSLIILFAMAVTFLISCSGEGAQLLPFINPVEEATTFGGLEWKIGKVQDYFMDEDAVLGYVDNTMFSDAARARIDEVEKKYDIVYTELLVERANDAVFQDSLVGASTYHAVQDESFFLVDGIMAGLYSDFTELSDYLDYKDSTKWGNPSALESLCWNGGLYAVMPAAMPLLSYSSATNIIVANVEYIRGIGMPDPRTYWENEEWTWDKFTEILPLYTNVSEDADDYKYGLLGGCSWLMRSMLTSNCGGYIYKDTDGTYKPVTATDAGRRALEAAWNLCFGDLAYTIDDGTSVLDYESVFPRGNHALVNVDSYQIYSTSKSLVYTMNDLAILPFPTGPDMPVGTIVSGTSSIDYAIAIPYLADEPWVSAVILDALYSPFEGYETEEEMVDYLMSNYFSTEQDSRLFIELTKNMTSEYSRVSYSDVLCFGLDNKTTVAAYIDSSLAKAQSIIDEFIVPRISTAEDIFN